MRVRRERGVREVRRRESGVREVGGMRDGGLRG